LALLEEEEEEEKKKKQLALTLGCQCAFDFV
jgi:hypothetical protein